MEQSRRPLAMHPKKFALWLFMVSITMLFGAFTSAFMVKMGEEAIKLDLPMLFGISTGIIVLSSVSMHWALISARKNEMGSLKGMLISTFLLGVAFLVTQYMGWAELVKMGAYLTGDSPLKSFIYVFTGMHGLHLVSGLVFLAIALYAAYKYKVHSKSLTLIEMCTTYWHFLGGLWIYLFLFLSINL